MFNFMHKCLWMVALTFSVLSAQNYNWVKHVKNPIKDRGQNAITITDGNNNYLLGSFGRYLYFDNDSIGSNGESDLFIIKYNSSGQELWIKSFGGDNPPNRREALSGIFSSECNCIYLSGIFYDTLILSDEIQLKGTGYENIFIAKMDLDGNFLWANRIDTISRYHFNFYGPNRYASIFEHKDNGFLILGYVYDTTTIVNELVNRGLFIAHFDSSGNLVNMIKDIMPQGDYSRTKLCQFSDDRLWVYGYFYNLTYQLADTTLALKGKQNFFISQFNNSGELLHIRQYGKLRSSDIQSLVMDDQKNIYITGVFEDSLYFGSQGIYTSGTDIYMAKLDSSLEPIWVKQMHVTGQDYFIGGTTLTIAPNDDVYLSGTFAGQAWFDDFYVATENQRDWFLSRFTPEGLCLGVIHSGPASNRNHCIDNAGRIIFSGTCNGSMQMGDTLLVSINNANSTYVASIDSNFTYSEAFRTRNNELVIITNPNKGDCRIMLPDELRSAPSLHLRVSNSMGQVILDEKYDSNRNNIHINIQSEASGVYHASLSSGNLVFHGKIMFE